jgi:hypothetical protein
MCDECCWEDFIPEIEAALSDVEELPEAAADFAVSVEEKLSGIQFWIQENEHITDAQAHAVKNMMLGIQKWLQ